MNHVYLLAVKSGEYDDHEEWIEGVFTTPEAALAFAATHWPTMEFTKVDNTEYDRLYIGHRNTRPYKTYYSIDQWELNPIERERDW